MTGVLHRPAAPPESTGAGGSRPGGGQRRSAPDPAAMIALAGELALGLVTLAAAMSLARLFSDWDFALPVAAAVAAGHGAAIAGRRLGLAPLPVALLSVGALVGVVTWVVEPHTTTLGIPGPATWDAVVADLSEAWARFGEVRAPTPTTRAFVLATVIGTWLVATAADAFAFRLRARFEAVAPSFTVLVFAGILAPAGDRGPALVAAATYLAAVLCFLLATEVARRSLAISWFAGASRRGTAALVRRGGMLALGAVVVGVVAGPHLPGASAPGSLGLGSGDGGNRSRTTVSPLVDIRARLVDQSGLELFTVAASAPAYWRLTSLETFDGTIWSSLSTYEPARGALAAGATTRGRQETITQDFAIGPLSTIWLPAAFRPTRVQGVPEVRHDPESASLLTSESSVEGMAYSVESALPRFTADQLAAAGSGVPPDVAETYLDLPAEFPASAAELARQVADDAGSGGNPYLQAVALQDWFREEFTYDLEVPAGHGLDAITAFLQARRGYCEQFSATFAAMARYLGVPARVAVGFTSGSLADDGRYHVAGKDAHAWPEVYIAGYGWVAFEPTPGRSIPGAAYTGQRARAGPEPGEGATPTTAVPQPGDLPGPPPEEEPETPPAEEPLDPATDGGVPGGRLTATLALVALVNGGYLALLALARRWLRFRRRAAAAEPSQAVLVAWAEAEEALALAGIRRARSETPGEYVVRLARTGMSPAVVEPVGELVALTEIAGFAPAGAARAEAEGATRAVADLERALRESAGWQERLRWAVDPRPLLRRAASGARWRPPPAGGVAASA